MVEDGLGRPLPGARVDVVRQDTGETVWTAFTTGDGVAPYYPELVVPGWGRPAPGSPERAPLQVVGKPGEGAPEVSLEDLEDPLGGGWPGAEFPA